MYNLSTLPTSAICDVQKEHEQAAFKWQKEFKTSLLDYEKLNQALAIDNIYSNGKVGLTKNLMVTCLDQFPAEKFHYDKLNVSFTEIYQSCSPITENIFKKCENIVDLSE